jgi:hypothetical protein
VHDRYKLQLVAQWHDLDSGFLGCRYHLASSVGNADALCQQMQVAFR